MEAKGEKQWEKFNIIIWLNQIDAYQNEKNDYLIELELELELDRHSFEILEFLFSNFIKKKKHVKFSP